MGRVCGDTVPAKSGQDHEVVALGSRPASGSPVILCLGGQGGQAGYCLGAGPLVSTTPAGLPHRPE